jgi:tetratricopeptide (TPR) repeat protein
MFVETARFSVPLGNFAVIGKTAMDMLIPSDLMTFWLAIETAKKHVARSEYDCAISALTEAIHAADRQVHCPKTGSTPPYEAYCEAHYERGLAYEHKNKHDEAIRDFDAVIEEAKNPVVATRIKKWLGASYLRRGILFACRGAAGSAIDDFTHFIQLNPHCSEAYYRRALAYKENHDLHLAEKDFDLASDMDPLGFHELRRAFSSMASAKACVTFPDTRFGKTLGDQQTRIEL